MESNYFIQMQPGSRLAELTLSSEILEQVNQFIAAGKEPPQVNTRQGSLKKISAVRAALFQGPPGAGKSRAAAAIGRELDSPVYRVDLPALISKYIGETEKKLDRVFKKADEKNAILFFDEADALFGKRSEVKDAHDRYANQEVTYLLQKIAAHEGLVILSSDKKATIDKAFIRRLRFVVEF